MPHYDEMYPGRFLKGTTLTSPRTIRIVEFSGETLEGERGEQLKGVLKFNSAAGAGEAVWCKTNAILTAKVLGEDDYTKWAGRLITIHYDKEVMFGKDKVGGIRVFGSPELKAQKRIEIKRPKRRAEVYVLRVTDKNGAEVAPHDPVTGEVKP